MTPEHCTMMAHGAGHACCVAAVMLMLVFAALVANANVKRTRAVIPA